MKTYKELITEAKGKLVQGKIYNSPKDFEIIYTFTDGKQYSLSNDGSVFWANFKDPDLGLDGVPHLKRNLEYFVMEFKGVLGIYDSNMDLVRKFKNMKDLVNTISDFMDEEGIVIHGWET